jgi:CheY-like chemotaxis protein
MMTDTARGAKAGPGRVLVVDDDPGVLEVTMMVLRNHGWQAEGAGDGLDALRRLQHEPFDVVVTDLQMPRLDGLGLLREILRMEHPPPVVVQTSLLDAPLETRLHWAGAFRVLMKGGPLRDLVRSAEEAWAASTRGPARCA